MPSAARRARTSARATPVKAGAEGGVESRLIVTGHRVVPPALVALQVSAAVAVAGLPRARSPTGPTTGDSASDDAPGHAHRRRGTSRSRRRAPPARPSARSPAACRRAPSRARGRRAGTRRRSRGRGCPRAGQSSALAGLVMIAYERVDAHRGLGREDQRRDARRGRRGRARAVERREARHRSWRRRRARRDSASGARSGAASGLPVASKQRVTGPRELNASGVGRGRVARGRDRERASRRRRVGADRAGVGRVLDGDGAGAVREVDVLQERAARARDPPDARCRYVSRAAAER